MSTCRELPNEDPRLDGAEYRLVAVGQLGVGDEGRRSGALDLMSKKVAPELRINRNEDRTPLLHPIERDEELEPVSGTDQDALTGAYSLCRQSSGERIAYRFELAERAGSSVAERAIRGGLADLDLFAERSGQRPIGGIELEHGRPWALGETRRWFSPWACA